VLNVFCAADGRHGNTLGVVRDPRPYRDRTSRQALAAELGHGETLFVDDPERGAVESYSPGERLLFPGHGLVGAAWLLDLEELNCLAGSVWARGDGEFSWITARADWVGPTQLAPHTAPEEVDALTAPPPGEGCYYAWAWEEEAAGRVRARAFLRGPAGAAEEEASGAAAVLLTDLLGRALNITQGRGSQLLTAPGPDGEVELGGRVRISSQAPVLVPVPPPAAVPKRRLSVAEALSRMT
jgi:predicted PhzF superfamily epimerase YddE/YHI9